MKKMLEKGFTLIELMIVVAIIGIMVYRIWYWTDNCVINKTFPNPPLQCGVYPFDFKDNYIQMRSYNQAWWISYEANGQGEEASSHSKD